MPRPPRPPRKSGSAAPCWYSRLLYSNLLASSIFIESPSKGGAYCERYVGTFSAFVHEKSLDHFFFHYTDLLLLSPISWKRGLTLDWQLRNQVPLSDSFAKRHHAITGPFYGVEKVLHEAFCNSNAVEAYSKTEVWSRDADLQGGNKGMLSRVKPSSPVYSLYIVHTCEEKNIKRIDSTQSRSSHINSQR